MKITPKEKGFNFFFIIPALALFLVFSLYPIIRTFQLSFYQWNGIDREMLFVGFAQYKDILFNNPAFWKSMLNAGYVTILALTLQNGLALLLALLFVRALDKASAIHQAMICRGFDGRFKSLGGLRWRVPDTLLGLASVLLVIGVAYLETA